MYNGGRIADSDMQIFVLVLGNQHWNADKGDLYRVLTYGIVIDVINFLGALCSVRQNKRICAHAAVQAVVAQSTVDGVVAHAA